MTKILQKFFENKNKNLLKSLFFIRFESPLLKIWGKISSLMPKVGLILSF